MNYDDENVVYSYLCTNETYGIYCSNPQMIAMTMMMTTMIGMRMNENSTGGILWLAG